jgi:hypothetical protein
MASIVGLAASSIHARASDEPVSLADDLALFSLAQLDADRFAAAM